MLPLLLLSAAASAAPLGCEPGVTTEALATELDKLETAFIAADEAGFQTAFEAFEAQLPCVDAPLDPGVAARVHRAQGARAYLAMQPELTVGAFASARLIEPSFRFPEEAAPAGGPLEKEYLAVELGSRSVAALEAPAGVELLVDGQPARERSADWPVLVQLIGAEQAVAATAYLWPGEPLPTLPEPPPPEPVAAPEPSLADAPAPVPSRGRQIALFGVAGVAAASSVASLLVADTAASDYRDNSHSLGELNELRGRANTWTALAGGAGLVALGAGTGAVLVARW
jgi:hypothetical protein